MGAKDEPQVSRRKRGMKEKKTITSPYDKSLKLVIRKATNREDVERQNLFSKMRTIQNVGTPNELIIERDIQMGQVQIDTILLCMDDWNLADEDGEIYPMTEDNLLDFFKPAERRWAYQMIMEYNPMWLGEEEAKEDSEEISNGKSTPSLEAQN